MEAGWLATVTSILSKLDDARNTSGALSLKSARGFGPTERI
jgi:hypothetical protein